MITKESIEQLKDSIDIVSIIERYIPLKKIGINFSACCPFHKEKTPSFMVNKEKGLFHCFGCGKTGDAISFVMEIENINFTESVEKIAELQNFSLTYSKRETQGRDDLLEHFSNFYAKKLQDSPTHLSYLKERGIQENSIQQFNLGYCGPSVESIKFAESINAKDEATELGVLGKNEDRTFARFSDRIIFPIKSPSGKVIGFGGRKIKENSNRAKYVNSPQSKIFNKSKILYGYHLAKKYIFQKKEIIITEGYIDVIMMHQAGIKNTVATLGTALTKEHIPLLSNGEPKIIICFDGDTAGIDSAYRVAKMMAIENKDGGIVILPKGDDPASLIQKEKAQEIQTLISSPKQFIDFVLERDIEKYNLDDIHQKQKALKDCTIFLKSFPLIVQEHYKSILSKLLNVPEEVVGIGTNKKRWIIKDTLDIDPIEASIIKTMFLEKICQDFAFEYIDEKSFNTPSGRELFSFFRGENQESKLMDKIIGDKRIKKLEYQEFKKQIAIVADKHIEKRMNEIMKDKSRSFDEKSKEMKILREKREKLKKETT